VKDDGTVWAWGFNREGELGDGTTTNRLTPVQALGLTDMISVAAGDMHSLGLKGDGAIYAWGRNDHGGIGDGTTSSRIRPVLVPGTEGFHATGIEAGGWHSLAVLRPAAGTTTSTTAVVSTTSTAAASTTSTTTSSTTSTIPSATTTTVLCHPSDANHDFHLTISEMTAYGAAWKKGQGWTEGPAPIPIGYVTRAGYLWRSGEVYHYDPTADPAVWVTGN
jgi:hypothetical protein